MSHQGASKRGRAESDSGDESEAGSAASSSSALAPKVLRSSSPPPPLFTCTLPPTCSNTPSVHATSESLDAHNLTYHSFVCHATPIHLVDDPRAKGKQKVQPRGPDDSATAAGGVECGRIFPSQRFLDLHLTECHDSLALVRSERGEKIFACFQPDCKHTFATAKGRRLHLIDKHQYPEQYFFAVTLWGVKDVLRKGGGMAPPHLDVDQPEPAKEPTPTPDSAVDDLAASFAKSAISMVPRSRLFFLNEPNLLLRLFLQPLLFLLNSLFILHRKNLRNSPPRTLQDSLDALLNRDFTIDPIRLLGALHGKVSG
ncbi:hypothetical protein RQP46_003630 [Phenoliferia psychrophenolica]